MNTGLITLTADELLSRYKLLGFYEPMLDSAAVELSPGVDLDRLLMMQIDAWYARQFHEAPKEILPVSEIAPLLTPERLPDGAAGVMLPEGTVRVISVMMDGWKRYAEIVSDPASPRARAQTNRYSRGGCSNPVAVATPDGRMTLYTPPPDKLALTSVKAIVMPESGTYLFTPALLATLPNQPL